jgi:GNAT superfamily N-acetyltransferase
VRVREIADEDMEAVEAIARALQPQWFTESALTEIANAIRTQNGYVAEDGGILIGFAMYQPLSDGRTAELTWVGVRPNFHRRGTGRRLVEAIERELITEGLTILEVHTLAATVNYVPYSLTRSFYHEIGFVDVSVEPKGFPSGDDKLFLRKQLR